MLHCQLKESRSIRIHKLKDNNWCLLGVVGNGNPPENSYILPTAYGWACGADVFIGGKKCCGAGGWQGFEEGDEAVFMFYPQEKTLILTMNWKTPDRSYIV